MKTGCTIVMPMNEKESFIKACESHNIFWSGVSKMQETQFEAYIKTAEYKKIAEGIKPLYAVSVSMKKVVTILNDNSGVFSKNQNATVGDKLIEENHRWIKIN